MTFKAIRLADGQLWLRVVDPDWEDPVDPSFAAARGGRWNPPASFPTLYLNEDLDTARAQVVAVLDGSPVEPDDLEPGFDLVSAILPRSQDVAGLVEADDLERAGLPRSYPNYRNGRPVGHELCQVVGERVHQAGLRGVKARSAVHEDGRELAWYPARSTSRAKVISRIPFSEWWFSG